MSRDGGLISRESLPEGELKRLFRERLARVVAEHATHLDPKFAANPFRRLRRRFVVAHSPRVGSHFLCEGLLKFGASVEEVFEEPRIRNVSAKRGFQSVQEYCEWVVRRHAPHGVFGVSGGVKVFAPLEMARELPRFANQWPIVFITRRDIVAQAVSEAIALTTRAYKASTRPSRVLAADDYDAESIARSIDASLAVNAGWEGAFLHYRIEPLRLAYEDLIADPEGVTARAAQFIDIDGPPVTQKWLLFEPLRRQADALNEAWIARFRAEQSDFCDQREAGFFRLDGGPARAVEALGTP